MIQKQKIEIYESPAVLKHLEFLQNIISRLSNKSASCKTWAITLTSAILVISLDECSIPIWIFLLPVSIMYFLDSFYLGLERNFIKIFNQFVKKMHNGNIEKTNIFEIKSRKSNFFQQLWLSLSQIFRYSTLMFYIPFITIIILLNKLIK